MSIYLCAGIVTLGFWDNPYPRWQITRTRVYGYGFAGVWVRVGLENPRVTRGDP